jgi:hypothetical protein
MLIEYKYYSRKRQKLQERKSPAKKKEAALPDVCREEQLPPYFLI